MQSWTLDELVRECLEPGAPWEVEAYFWSDDIPLRFEVEDGEPRLIEVTVSKGRA